MNLSKASTLCVMVLSFNVSFVRAAQVLRAVPEKVELGTFNTFQIKEAIVKLSNTGRKTFMIDKVKADCSCIGTSISTEEIPPGKTVELKIVARERTGGKFSHDVLIIPKDIERYESLKIQAAGNVIEPVSARIGWKNKKLTMFDPNRPVDLGLVHQLSAEPVICLTTNVKHFNLRDSVPEVNSTQFELNEYKFDKLSAINQKQMKDGGKEILTLTLRPKKTLKIGVLKELMKIRLANNVQLEMPITARIVGNVYAEESIVHLGNLSKTRSQELTIHFTNCAEVWPDVTWDIKGYLSDAIVISKNRSKRTDSSIVLTLGVNQYALSYLPKGYVFCRAKFYRNRSINGDIVSVLVDGFNIESDI